MPIFGHSKFLPVFLYQKGLNKFRMHIFGHSKFICLFGKNCWKKFRMAIFGHSKFIPVFLGKIVRKNLEWPLLAIPNLYQSFWEKLSEKIWNGHLHPMQRLARCNNNCDVTVATLPNTTVVIWVTITSMLDCLYKVPYKQCLYVRYKSELIIT